MGSNKHELIAVKHVALVSKAQVLRGMKINTHLKMMKSKDNKGMRYCLGTEDKCVDELKKCFHFWSF